MGECHLEYYIGDPELVILGDLDNAEVPTNHKEYRDDNPRHHVNNRENLTLSKTVKNFVSIQATHI